MEERKLTKADIDKVRHIEGFPIGKDEDIIALSRPPYYTACPNPFIEDFIRENGTPYDEATDDYHREPFAADVSEGKNDPIYNAHSYHTKVPYKAIMRYILHYTKPGDIVFDGFCGSGMTGVAAQMCGCPDDDFKANIEQEMPGVIWGARKAVLNDLSPAATFIAFNYNTPIDVSHFEEEAYRVLKSCSAEYGWMYETQHVDQNGTTILSITNSPVMGKINYTVWSDVFICPSCSHELVFGEIAYDLATDKVSTDFTCPHCAAKLKKDACEHAHITEYDPILKRTVTQNKHVPFLINYSVGTRRYNKKPDSYDESIIERIQEQASTLAYEPQGMMLKGGSNWGEIFRAGYHYGIEYAHQFYTLRNLTAVLKLWESTKHPEFRWMITAILNYVNKKQSFTGGGGGMPGVLYIASLVQEKNVFDVLERKIGSLCKAYHRLRIDGCFALGTGSSTELSTIPSNSIDYIFVDPPFGANIMYSEASFLWEDLLKVYTNNQHEAIQSSYQKKGLADYQELIEKSFSEFVRILKPGHWMTIEFHNSQNAVWNAIQEALLRAGLVIADVRTLDKQQRSFKQVTSQGAVKQDLVISAYKPKESFVREFQNNAGDPEMAWEFVRQHLRNVPVVADGNHDGKLDIVAERQDYLLFDRMVAWHIMNGIPVPMDAHTFYDGLRQRFLQRDGMFFLPDQVNEYDDKRAHMELDAQQLSFLVTDEKNAIAWLNYILSEGPKTYQEIQPAYLQELHQSKQEKMPELLDMLRENFVQDDKGAWYVPDLSNAADLAKVRRKALLKEFYDSCVPGKGKLKVFRMEAIRAGFDECWKQRDFKTIVSVGERLPESVLQEDPALLMYYDNACSRV